MRTISKDIKNYIVDNIDNIDNIDKYFREGNSNLLNLDERFKEINDLKI